MRRRTALLAALLAVGVAPAAAHATDQVVTAAGNTFLPGTVTVDKGARLTFVNADAAPHNLVADATTRRGPLFASVTVTAGQSAEVKGIAALAPATYTFHCSVHPQMHGTLTVSGGTGPVVAVVPTGGNVPTATSAAYRDGGLFVTSYVANAVLRLPVLPGGLLGPATTYATGFSSPLGLAFAPDGWLYVTDSHQAADGSTVGRISTVQPGGGPVKVLVDNLPNGRHNTNGLAIRNGRLYVANGSSTDDGVHGGAAERPLSGTVLSYALPILPRAKPTIEVRGVRNVFDVAFRGATSELWFPSNGPDALAPYGEDLLHKADVAKPTVDFGFPACVYAAGLVRGQNPNVTTTCTGRFAAPERALGLHVSADGVAFGTGGAWGGDLYIAEYGSNDPSLSGHRVVRVPVTNGRSGPPQDVVVGPAPLDVVFGPDGLYVLDFDSGAILLLRAA